MLTPQAQSGIYISCFLCFLGSLQFNTHKKITSNSRAWAFKEGKGTGVRQGSTGEAGFKAGSIERRGWCQSGRNRRWLVAVLYPMCVSGREGKPVRLSSFGR